MNGNYRLLFKNVGYLTISNFASKILVFLLVPIYTSVLSAEEYGVFDAIVMTLLTLYKMMIGVNTKLTLLTLIPMGCIAIGGYYFGEYVEKKFAQKQEAFASLSDYVQESPALHGQLSDFLV